MSDKLLIVEVSILGDDAQGMISQLDQELRAEYAPQHMHTVEFQSFHAAGGVFVVAYNDGTPIGCGALRPINDADVELKRMFVAPPHRGRGISRRILVDLETRAKQRGFTRLVLETGDVQHAAIGLYQSSGYQRIEPFGEYVGGPRSVCFAKVLGA